MERKHLQFGDDPSIEFVTHENGEMHVEINDDWCGDSETGFGARLSHTLGVDEIAQLRAFLKIYDSNK
jgi:hypothetical protein